jgi:zeaxanthin glucosyltransferase
MEKIRESVSCQEIDPAPPNRRGMSKTRGATLGTQAEEERIRMAIRHIGLICPEISGHLNPMTTLGRELLRRGYRVSLLGIPDGQAKAVSAGLEFIPIGAIDSPLGSRAKFVAELGKLHGRAALRFTIERFREAGILQLRDIPDAVRAAEIDGLLIDQVSAPAATVAEYLDVPYVTICNALAANYEDDVPPLVTSWPFRPTPLGRCRNRLGYAVLDHTLEPVRRLISDQRLAWGMSALPPGEPSYSPLAQIAQQPAVFDFPRKGLPPWFHYTGPFHDERSGDFIDFPYERLTGAPLIYASMGTLQNRQDRVFHTIAAACAGLPAQLALSLGNPHQTALPDLPGSPLVVPYAPQLELVKRSALVITHAGLNTVLETLSQGVPMVAIPITNDQPGVAARLAWLGAGQVVPLAGLHADRLRTVVQKALSDPRYRERARNVQRQFQALDGVRRAADIAEQALDTRQPVLRTGGPL